MTAEALVRGPGRNEPCPCDSGVKSKLCCRTTNGWAKAALGSLLAVNGSTSTVDGCYAAPLGGCDGGLSKEHYFSKSILSRLDSIEVRGLPGAPVDQPRKLGINSLTAKVLCRGHNSSLSKLDTEAGRFFDAFRGITATATAGSFTLFAGSDIERWLLKTMLGFTASGAAPDEGRRVRVTDPFDTSLLKVLYEGEPLAEPAGLYFVEPRQGRFTPGHQSFGLLFNRVASNEAHVVGLQADMNGFSFALLLVKPEMGPTTTFNEVWYRPRQVWVHHGTDRNVVEFSWPDEDRRGVVRLVGHDEAPAEDGPVSTDRRRRRR